MSPISLKKADIKEEHFLLPPGRPVALRVSGARAPCGWSELPGVLPFPPLAAQEKRCSCSLWESVLNERVGLGPNKKLFFCFIYSLILKRAADKTEIRNN